MKAGHKFWPASLGLAATLCLYFPAVSRPGPRAWDFCLTLQTTGRYQVIDRGVTYNGDLAFTLIWEGTMERDEEDFRLIQRDTRLVDWKATETSSLPELSIILTTANFPAGPSFNYLYVLHEKNVIHVAFGLEGFTVPLHSSAEKVELDLPRTAQSGVHSSSINYDAYVTKGSNLLEFPADLIDANPVERNFAWSWRHRQWLETQDQDISLLNDHQVTAKVLIRPSGRLARKRVERSPGSIPRISLPLEDISTSAGGSQARS
jgi:hypothetical protein